MRTFRRQPLVLVRGEGCYVWDEDGRRYLDLVAGIAVNVLGHAHPALLKAIADQAAKLIHVSNLYYSIPQVQFGEMLTQLTGMDQVFFTNSGAEANEAAIKLARKYGKVNKNGAYEIITAVQSFHGRTMATLAATGQEKYQLPFTPLPAGFLHTPYNDIAALRDATSQSTVAIMLEPVQGESGIHSAQEEYLAAVREWCDQHGLLLILDEVQTGLGRTGTFLAAQGFGIKADIVTLAKGLCGGLPVGAVLAHGSASCFEPGDHGSTIGGNPLVCAAGIATMSAILDGDLIANAAQLGRYFLGLLTVIESQHDIVSSVRGRGLMLALDLLEPKAAELVELARERGLLVNNTGPSTIRMVPPLILKREQVDVAIEILAEALGAL
jgi:predicted acetylornithine/succinylornithine family transaminase